MAENQNGQDTEHDLPVIVTDHGRVRVITINRPGALNAMNNSVFAGIRDALIEVEDSNDIAVAVLTGNGRAFSAGQDLGEMQAGSAGHNDGEKHQFPSMLLKLTEFRKPLLAAVNGIGVGIGMTIVAHCDLAFMSTDARLRTPFPQLGVAPEAGSSYTFVERMGWQNAAYTLMSGRWFSAEECLEMGLVWRISQPDRLMDDTLTVAQELAANPIPSLIETKQLLLAAGRTEGARSAHSRELKAFSRLLGAPANTEAVAAFMEKREPDFTSISGL
ncbi:MAG: enoyl-CoA hydratase/isomerase family protein [Acidimicrobiales bacterium]